LWPLCLLSRQEIFEVLARRRSISSNGQELARTPILLPSFSSKGFPDVEEILRTAEEFIEGEMLVSAYDLHYGEVGPPFDFSPLIFLDSGGYEATKDAELSDLRELEHSPKDWNENLYKQTISRIPWNVPTVVISYDHPRERLSISDQIHRANRLLPDKAPNILREILLKPETASQTLLHASSVVPHIHALSEFDVIGVTEKEIGKSMLDRMRSIARLRSALTKAGLNTPIHVFGSLDTISSPLYFVAGADIFDGLTWLRFAYRDGLTIYKHNYGALELGVEAKVHMVDGRSWFHNYYYLREMQLEMRRFLMDYDFRSFRHHSQFIESAYRSVLEAEDIQDGR
jgi:hypothetical protein